MIYGKTYGTYIHIDTAHVLLNQHVFSLFCSHCVPQDGWTALMLAIFWRHTDVVHALLSGGAQPDLQNKVSTAHIEMPTLLQPCNLASQFKHSKEMQ